MIESTVAGIIALCCMILGYQMAKTKYQQERSEDVPQPPQVPLAPAVDDMSEFEKFDNKDWAFKIVKRKKAGQYAPNNDQLANILLQDIRNNQTEHLTVLCQMRDDQRELLKYLRRVFGSPSKGDE